MNSIVEIEDYPKSYIIDLSNIKDVKFHGLIDYGVIEIELLRGNEYIFKRPDENELILHSPKIEINFSSEERMLQFKDKLLELWSEYNNWYVQQIINELT